MILLITSLLSILIGITIAVFPTLILLPLFLLTGMLFSKNKDKKDV